MNILILSESYGAKENRKNLTALGKLCTVRCISPDRPVGGGYDAHGAEMKTGETRSLLQPCRIMQLHESQIIFLSTNLGLRNFRPDIIHAEFHPWSVTFLQILLYQRMRARHAKIVCTIKKNTYVPGSGFKATAKRGLTRFGVGKVDHFIAASKMAATLCREKLLANRERISVCHHMGVDTELFRPAGRIRADDAGRALVIGYCGRLDADKGVTELIQAVRKIRKGNDHVILKLLGGGLRDSETYDHISGLAENSSWLEIHPPVSHADVVPFLQALDLFVMPARILPDHQEHDGHAIMEAMACGLPCIGTNSGIIPEIIRDGESGIVIPPADSESLATALNQLVRDTGKRATLGENARRQAEAEFALDTVAREKHEIYKRAMND